MSSSVIPITAFIGVRISWLMAARKADLATVADSAWSRALAIVATERLTAVAICAISRGPDTSAGSLRSPSAMRNAAAVTRSTGRVTRRSTVYPATATSRAPARTSCTISERVAAVSSIVVAMRWSSRRCSSACICWSRSRTCSVACVPAPSETTAWAASVPSARRSSAVLRNMASRICSGSWSSWSIRCCRGLSDVSASRLASVSSTSGRDRSNRCRYDSCPVMR